MREQDDSAVGRQYWELQEPSEEEDGFAGAGLGWGRSRELVMLVKAMIGRGRGRGQAYGSRVQASNERKDDYQWLTLRGTWVEFRWGMGSCRGVFTDSENARFTFDPHSLLPCTLVETSYDVPTNIFMETHHILNCMC